MIKIRNGKQELEVSRCAYNSWFKGLGFEEVNTKKESKKITVKPVEEEILEEVKPEIKEEPKKKDNK